MSMMGVVRAVVIVKRIEGLILVVIHRATRFRLPAGCCLQMAGGVNTQRQVEAIFTVCMVNMRNRVDLAEVQHSHDQGERYGAVADGLKHGLP